MPCCVATKQPYVSEQLHVCFFQSLLLLKLRTHCTVAKKRGHGWQDIVHANCTFTYLQTMLLCLQVMKIVDEDLSACHVLAAAMQQGWPGFITYMDETAKLMVC